MQDLIIVFSQNFDLYQNYINLNATNVPSDIQMLEWEREKIMLYAFSKLHCICILSTLDYQINKFQII